MAARNRPTELRCAGAAFHWWRWAAGCLVWSTVFLLLWQWVDVSLIYHGGSAVRDFPVFYWGFEFLSECLNQPGGAATYVSAWLAQGLFHAWLGALLLTCQAWVIYAAARGCLASADAERLELGAWCVPLILLGIYSGYLHSSAEVAGLAVALPAACLQLRRCAAPAWQRVATLGLISILLAAAATGAVMTFLTITTLAEIRSHKRWWIGLWPVLVGVGISWVWNAWIFGLTSREVVRYLFRFPWTREPFTARGPALLLAAHSLVPLLLLADLMRSKLRFGGAIRRRLKARPSFAKGARHARLETRFAGRAGLFLSRWQSPVWLRDWSGATLAMSAAIVVVGTSLDRPLKSRLQVDYYGWHSMWPEALAAAEGSSNRLQTVCSTCQAAFHSGRLGDLLPRLQKPTDLLLESETLLGHWKKSDLYYDLGYVNLALHHLTEAVEVCGERPLLLQRLALVHLAAGNRQAGVIYLQALTRSPFHSAWAQERLQQLETDPDLSRDPEVARLRRLSPRQDVVGRLSIEQTLLLLLETNPQNRMAFEYLLTYYLLTRNLDGFTQLASRADAFPAGQAPPLWDEALALVAKQRGRPLPGREPSLRAQERLATFLHVLESSGTDRERVRSTLPPEYVQSYLYFYLLGS